MASLAFGRHVYPDQVHTEGITKVTQEDVRCAAAADSVIKLIGRAVKQENGRLYAVVAPMVIPKTSLLSDVNDVFNGIMVRGDAIGDVVFYGRGAGKLPTASAVVADVIDEVKHLKARKYLCWERGEADYVIPHGEGTLRLLLRVTEESDTAEKIARAFGEVTPVTGEGVPAGQVAFITPARPESELAAVVAASGLAVHSVLRVADM